MKSAVGAYLINSIQNTNINLLYWRSENYEIDFLLQYGEELIAIEVKSGAQSSALPRMKRFNEQFKVKRNLLLGAEGIPLEDFLNTPVEDSFS